MISSNARAFLGMISACEGAGYQTLYGGGTFDSFADHPRKAVTAGGYTSTAAGAYQILSKTWDAFVKANGTHLFYPEDQDACALWLIRNRGAAQDVESGNLAAAIAKCGKEWASLPGSPYGQPTRSYAYCEAKYLAAGGVLASTPVQVPPDISTVGLPAAPEVKQPESHMGALALLQMFGPILSNLLPQIAPLLGAKGDKVTQYAGIAKTVLDTITTTTGAPNLQGAVEAMQDPSVKAAVQAAVVSHPDVIGFMEVGGGVPAARAGAIAMQNADKPFWFNPAFWVSMILLVFPFMLCTDAFFVHTENYGENARTQIVTGVLAVIMIVGGFWLGTSFGSQRKTELNAAADKAV
jgi:muramidase (phage lysozyme)